MRRESEEMKVKSKLREEERETDRQTDGRTNEREELDVAVTLSSSETCLL